MTAVALTVRRGSCIIVHTKSPPLEHGSGSDEMQAHTTLHFMTRLGEAGEVAHLVHFLASGPGVIHHRGIFHRRWRDLVRESSRRDDAPAVEQAGADRCG